MEFCAFVNKKTSNQDYKKMAQKWNRTHKRTKHSGMGGCEAPTSSEYTSPCINIEIRKSIGNCLPVVVVALFSII